MFSIKHKVRYYETDKMGVTHHSNYIRFMEEARIEWMNSIGFGYKKCEELGIVSPVVSVNCKYLKNTTFDDEIIVKVKMKSYTGIRMKVEYEMICNEQKVAIGESEHCFVSMKTNNLVRIKNEFPKLNEIFENEIKCLLPS